MKELDSENGIGLIEKKRSGFGKPDIIYVKNFATMSAEQEEKEQMCIRDRFPSYMSITSDNSQAEIEEERRLAYVGITRAKKNLTITSARVRMVRGPVSYTHLAQQLSKRTVERSRQKIRKMEVHFSGFIWIWKIGRAHV